MDLTTEELKKILKDRISTDGVLDLDKLANVLFDIKSDLERKQNYNPMKNTPFGL